MTARTSTSEVKAIVSTTLTDAQIQAFIDTAALVVTTNLADKGLSAELLEAIEMWLAAHLLSMRDQRVHARTIGDVSFTYQGQTGLGLDATLYGQQVKMLDTTGTLASLGKRRASVTVFSEADSAA